MFFIEWFYILGLNDLSVYSDHVDLVKPSNPFVQQQKKENTLLEVALEVLQTMTCRKGPSKCNKIYHS